MKKIINILIAVTPLLAAQSCDFLDLLPQNFLSPEEYYQNETQLNSAMLGVYASLSTSPLYCNNMLGRAGLDADLGYNYYNLDNNSVGQYDVSSSDAKVTNYWKTVYQGINRANLLLEQIDGADASEAVKKDIRGQALFMRAYYHFMLTVRFGDVPLVTRATRSVAREKLQLRQSSRDEMYEQIIQDLEEAARLLPEASEISCGARASKSAAYGIMARVCLNAAGYPLFKEGMYAEARNAAEKVIATGFHELNPSYQQVFINLIQDVYDIKECIFEVDFWGTDVGTYTTAAGMVGRNNGVYFSNAALADEIGISIGCLRATPYYYQLFEEGDLRRDWTIADYQLDASTGEEIGPSPIIWERCCGKFRRSYELNSPKARDKTSTNFPILRYSDVLLMYAEAVACDPDDLDAGRIALAYEYINQVRRRGFGLDINAPSGIDIPNEGKYFILENVKDERARELGYELTRKDDIVRWGEFYNRMKAVGATVPSSSESYASYANAYFSNVEMRDFVWPIPAYDMGINRKLKQNQGW